MGTALLLLWFAPSCTAEPGVGDDDSAVNDDSGDDDDAVPDDDDAVPEDDDAVPDDDDVVPDDDDSAASCDTPHLLHEVQLHDLMAESGNYYLFGTYTSTNPCAFTVQVGDADDDCMMRGCDVFAPDGVEVASAFIGDGVCDYEPTFLLQPGASVVEEGGSQVPAQSGIWQASCLFMYTLDGVHQSVTVNIEYETESI